MNSKEYFFDEVIKEVSGNNQDKPIRVLELGCGTAVYVPAMIEKYSHLEYVGIEPITSSFEKATEILSQVPRTKISSQLGYDSIEGLEDASFDVVISFSVLEHVKQLEKFMKLSARYVKQGGTMVHRYDLGHALHPTTLKEKLHVWLGNTIPAVLPERTFVRYVPMTEVVEHYKTLLNTDPHKYTYHQMPNHKSLVKALDASKLSNDALNAVYGWEFAYSTDFAKLDLPIREILFPTVAVWGKMLRV
jgi:SAM-dependent methyltransferase